MPMLSSHSHSFKDSIISAEDKEKIQVICIHDDRLALKRLLDILLLFEDFIEIYEFINEDDALLLMDALYEENYQNPFGLFITNTLQFQSPKPLSLTAAAQRLQWDIRYYNTYKLLLIDKKNLSSLNKDQINSYLIEPFSSQHFFNGVKKGLLEYVTSHNIHSRLTLKTLKQLSYHDR